jgi:hypothetical protein
MLRGATKMTQVTKHGFSVKQETTLNVSVSDYVDDGKLLLFAIYT